MTRNTLAAASAATVGAMLVVSLCVGAAVPDGIELPIHWNIAGEPDAFAPKWTALLLPPAIVAAVAALFHFLPAIEPLGRGLERSRGLYLWGWAALLFVGLVIELVVVAAAFAWPVPVGRVITGAMAVLLFATGNQLGKSRRMYLIGIRTPWTLASEEVWIRTHRLAGKLMVGGAAVMLVAALLPLPPALLGPIVLTVVAAAAGIPIVYSLILWKREQAAQPSGYSSTAE